MSDEFQQMFEIILLCASGLGGYVLHSIATDIKKLKSADDHILEQVTNLEKQVAGQYVTRSEFSHTMDRLYDKIDKIHNDVVALKQDTHLLPCKHIKD